MAMSAARVPLKKRPLDLAYASFFVMHVFASFCVDGALNVRSVSHAVQPLVPVAYVPQLLQAVLGCA